MNGSPRVLQVVLSLNPGGTERLVIELVRHLHRDIPMAVCCLDDAGSWANEVAALGVNVIALERSPGFQPRIGLRVADVARQHAATLLHCHHYSPFVYGCVAHLRRPHLDVVFTEHGRLSDAPPSGKRRLVNRLLARVPADVFSVSNDLKRHMAAEGFPARAIRTIYNGVDIRTPPSIAERQKVRAALAVSPETLVIATIARLDRVKDLSSLISAMPALTQRMSSLLVIIGDGPERRALESEAIQCGVDRYIRFLGYQSDAPAWLAGCDLYVNSSISEGISLTILEAMAAGLPVVATAVGGTPEIIDASCGVLTPCRKPAALAGAVLELAGDESRRRRLGEAARRRAEEMFSIERMVHEYREVYVRG